MTSDIASTLYPDVPGGDAFREGFGNRLVEASEQLN
jgi:hypothetical protein